MIKYDTLPYCLDIVTSQLTAEFSYALAIGNVDPASPDVINGIFPAALQVL